MASVSAPVDSAIRRRSLTDGDATGPASATTAAQPVCARKPSAIAIATAYSEFEADVRRGDRNHERVLVRVHAERAGTADGDPDRRAGPRLDVHAGQRTVAEREPLVADDRQHRDVVAIGDAHGVVARVAREQIPGVRAEVQTAAVTE